MTEHDELIDNYYAIRKAAFGFLERIELVQSVDPTKWNGIRLEIDLRSGSDSSSRTLRLEFSGVQDLRIGELAGLFRYMIEIKWIGESHMEGRKFKVTESEYDAISFVCNTFAAILA